MALEAENTNLKGELEAARRVITQQALEIDRAKERYEVLLEGKFANDDDKNAAIDRVCLNVKKHKKEIAALTIENMGLGLPKLKHKSGDTPTVARRRMNEYKAEQSRMRKLMGKKFDIKTEQFLMRTNETISSLTTSLHEEKLKLEKVPRQSNETIALLKTSLRKERAKEAENEKDVSQLTADLDLERRPLLSSMNKLLQSWRM